MWIDRLVPAPEDPGLYARGFAAVTEILTVVRY
jgi:hypothetical protein